MHAFKKGTGAAAEIQQPAPTVPTQFQPLSIPSTRQQAGPWLSDLRALLMGQIFAPIKLTDAADTWTRIRETQTASPALNHRKPQSATIQRGIRRFDKLRPIPAAAQKASCFFPFKDRSGTVRSDHWLRKEESHLDGDYNHPSSLGKTQLKSSTW
jgi:hypothetical protein